MSERNAIAIVGMSGRFPGADSLAEFWANVRTGRDALQEFSDDALAEAGVDAASRANPSWVRRGTVLEHADCFDAAFFGFAPREAQIMDPQQRVFLECAWEALEHAGYSGEAEGRTIGVYAGASMNSYVISQLLANPALVASVGGYQLMLGNDKDFLCTRVSYKLDLHGPSLTVQTACSTSLVAVQMACRSLQRGECDMALAGGVSITFPQRGGYQYQEGMILSPDGVCRPFDAEARGTRPGAGAGLVVLKRLEDALADRDTVHAVILGAAINNDGAGKAGYTAPSVDGQVEAIAMAQAIAGTTADRITYVEAHGTGTPLGDPIEIAALTRVFRASTDRVGYCTIGSLKANLGHLDAAAGVAGLIKTVLALQHRELPPLAHFRRPNPQLALETSPFRVPTTVEPWTSTEPRRAGVSSFGIGGTNAHVIVEEAPALAPAVTHRERQLLVLSARTPAALQQATANLAAHLGAMPATAGADETGADEALADVAYTLQTGRRTFAHRRVVVARTAADAATALAHPERPPVHTATHASGTRTVAFLFSGQGSQHARMGAALYRTEPVYRRAVDECAALLEPWLGADVRQLLEEGDDATVGATRAAQPLLFVTEYALAQLWMSLGVRPAAMLGHSIGEYVAAHLAGVLSLADALRLVAVRGQVMQAMAPGRMLSVQAPADTLRALLPDGAEIAAVNGPALSTASGPAEAIAALEARLSAAGIEHRALHTSHAFHSAMMEPALAAFREAVEQATLSAPRMPYVSNVTGTWITAEEATSPDYYVRHLRGTVQFHAGVEALAADPSRLLLEVGPGTVLSSLVRGTVGRERGALVVSSLAHPREGRADDDAFLSAVGRLWAAGVAIDWSAMHAAETLRRVPLPTYPFERQRHWVAAPAAATAASAASAPVPVARETLPRRAAATAPARRERLDDWFQVPSWMRVDVPLSARTPTEGQWLLFGADDALTVATRAAFERVGATVAVVTAGSMFRETADGYQVRPTHDDDHVALLRAAQAQGRTVAGVVHLWNALPDAVDVGGASSRELAMHAPLALGRALLSEAVDAPLTCLIATAGAQAVLDEPVTHPERALVDGPVLVLPVEHGALRLRAVDVDAGEPAAHAAERLVREVAASDQETHVAFRRAMRWVRRVPTQPLPAADPLPVKRGGVYAITGGLGGIGLTLAAWLGERAGARLLLTARTPLPPQDSWDSWLAANPGHRHAETVRRLQAIVSAGGEVLVASADASDREAMRQAFGMARARWGTIDGIIHGAGIGSARFIAQTDAANVDEVLRPKVDGVSVLCDIAGEMELDFVVLCSSISAVVGGAGLSVYAASNAYLDAFAASTSRPAGWRVVTIGWDSWREVGMAASADVPAAMRATRESYLATAIAPHEGAESLERLLASGLPRAVVSPFSVQSILDVRAGRVVAEREREPDAREPVTTSPRPAALTGASTGDSVTADAADAPAGAERGVLQLWEELLGTSSIALDDNFFELGGHSLMATRVLARIDALFGVRLPLRALFEAPTVRQLAATVDAALAANRPVAVGAGEREEFEL